jgi:mono/diheme cytochrome c family protein
MKKVSILVLLVFALASLAVAQIQAPTSDVLGAHLNYGRGCAACHAPHGGQAGNGAAHTQTSFNSYLWGQDTTALLGKSFMVSGNVVVNLPTALSATTPDVSGVLMCLSCHDGNYATGAMMRNQVYEVLPGTYGGNAIPTLLGDVPGVGKGDYTGNHPVGLNAVIGCGGQWNWDCTVSATGTVLMTGANSAQFVRNYGFFVKPAANTLKQPSVMCTTCHNQHLMNVVAVKNGATSGLPTGNYATMFFILAPYNPASGTAGSNQTAQFCRQCHGGEANESNGGGAIPTTF